MRATFLDAPCPLCHDETAITVCLPTSPCRSIQFVGNRCECSTDDLLAGPFDEVVDQVDQWRRDCYPYAIQGERGTPEVEPYGT